MDFSAGRILVVDDDAALLKLMASYLSRLGYRVDACAGADEAWAMVSASPSSYAGALVDLTMPGMRGDDLVRRILDLQGEMRVVVVSGHPTALSRMQDLGGGRVSFLLKPFAPKDLADALK